MQKRKHPEEKTLNLDRLSLYEIKISEAKLNFFVFIKEGEWE